MVTELECLSEDAGGLLAMDELHASGSLMT